MIANRREIEKEIEQTFGLVPAWVKRMPDSALPGFWQHLRDLQLGETKIPNKYKELIGLAVSGATRCRYCALFHTEAARLHGATDDEIAEASAMGAFTMMASTFINAEQIDFEQFRKETLQIADNLRKQAAKKPGGAPAKQPPARA